MTNVHGFVQDRILQNYTRLLAPTLESFIADRVFPATDVPTKTGRFYDVAGGFASQSPGHGMVMADGQASPLLVSTTVNKVDGWEVELNGLGCQISKSSAEYASGNGLDLRKAKAAILAREVAIIRERTAAAIAFSPAVFAGATAALAGPRQWSTAASAPIADAQTARTSIMQRSGEGPTTLIINHLVYAALRQHPLLVEFSSRTRHSSGLVSYDDIAAAMAVDEIIVGSAVGNPAVEGQAAHTAFLWGNSALFCRLRPSPAPMTPQSCLQRWRFQGSTDGAIRRWEPTPYVEQIDLLHNDQFAAPTPALGYLYTTVV